MSHKLGRTMMALLYSIGAVSGSVLQSTSLSWSAVSTSNMPFHGDHNSGNNDVNMVLAHDSWIR